MHIRGDSAEWVATLFYLFLPTIEARSWVAINGEQRAHADAVQLVFEASALAASRRSALVRREDGHIDDAHRKAGDAANQEAVMAVTTTTYDPFSDHAGRWVHDINRRLLNQSTYCCFDSLGQRDVSGYDAEEVRADFCGWKLRKSIATDSELGNCRLGNVSGTFLNPSTFQFETISDCEAICAASEECYGFVTDYSVLPRRCMFKATVTSRAQIQEQATDLYLKVWPNTYVYGQVDGWDEHTHIDAKSECCRGEKVGTIPGTWANSSFFHYVNLKDCQKRCNTAEQCKGFVAYHGKYPPLCGFKGGAEYSQDHADRDWYPRLAAA